MDAAVAKLRATARGERGVLKIGFAAHGAGEIGDGDPAAFRAGIPVDRDRARQRIHSRELQRKVVDRETDVAFAWLPLIYEELVALSVLAERRLVALHHEHPLVQKDAVRSGGPT